MNSETIFKCKLVAVVISIGICSGCSEKAPEVSKKDIPENPNIIYILTDDLGYGDLGVLFQNQLVTETSPVPRQFTPHLDRMAAEGAMLPHHYTAAPVCAPSRASFLLGKSQGHANVRDNQFDKALADELTVASALRKSGYATAAIGKWGLQGKDGTAPNWEAHPLERGFDYYLGYIRHRDGHEHYPKEGIYRGVKEVYENRRNITPDLDKCYTADLWTAAAKKWIVDHKQGQKGEQPFFMFLAYDTPHAVLELPTQAYPEGGGLEGGLQWTGEPGKMINTASGEVDSWMHPDYADAVYDHDGEATTPPEPWPNVYKRYATDTRRIDTAVGDLLQLLKDLEIDENTMVVFTSDNGPSRESYLENEPYEPTFFKSFGPFDGIKRDCWEGGLRMPTLARWPGKIPEGLTVSTPSISYDWMPTFIDAAGRPVPACSDGVSLLPSLTGLGDQPKSHVYVEYFQQGQTPDYDDFIENRQERSRQQMQMLRFGDTVAVRYDIKSQQDDFEIYDVVKDPQQKNDLADKMGSDSLQKRLKAKTLASRMPNSSAPRPYDDIAVPAVLVEELQKGISWKSFQGNFEWIPVTSGLQVAEKGIVDRPDDNVSMTESADLLYFEGYLEVPADGVYTFRIMEGDAVLRIHDALVIETDSGQSSDSGPSPDGTNAGNIRLKSGLHPFRLFVKFVNGDDQAIQLEWGRKGSESKAIPASQFFHLP